YEFLLAVEKAEAEAETSTVLTVTELMLKANKHVTVFQPDGTRRTIEVADGDLRLKAAESLGSRRWPERWSRAERQQVELGGTVHTKISVDEERERAALVLDVVARTGALAALAANLDAEVEEPEED